MKTYKVWATQLLYDEQFIEAGSAAEAERIAEKMYQETGELDPRDIIDGNFGVVEFVQQLDSEYTYNHRTDVPGENP